MPSIFGGAFDRLDDGLQKGILDALRLRRHNYTTGLAGRRYTRCKVILVGDRPGNGAKKLPANHHHTPFYSTKNSSLWLNRQLVEVGVNESDLFWLNSADLNGVPTSYSHLDGWHEPLIIALGGNASKWLAADGRPHSQVWHPQAWKRFHGKEPYPLLKTLDQVLDLPKVRAMVPEVG